MKSTTTTSTDDSAVGRRKTALNQESSGYTARASVRIDAPREDVWAALVDPEKIERYMFGTEVVTDWKEGADISW